MSRVFPRVFPFRLIFFRALADSLFGVSASLSLGTSLFYHISVRMSRVFEKFFRSMGSIAFCDCEGNESAFSIVLSEGRSPLPTLLLYYTWVVLSRGFSEVSEKIFVLSEIPNPLGRYRACLYFKAPDQISGDGRHSPFDMIIIP